MVGSVHVTKKISEQVLSSEMSFHNPWRSLRWIFFAFDGVTLMIFFWLSMVGQIFCFCHEWWVTSNDCFFATNGGSFQVIFFSTTKGGSFSNDFFSTPMWGHFKWRFFSPQMGVNLSDLFFPLPMGGHFKWFIFCH
jgi:hypothetical protein